MEWWPCSDPSDSVFEIHALRNLTGHYWYQTSSKITSMPRSKIKFSKRYFELHTQTAKKTLWPKNILKRYCNSTRLHIQHKTKRRAHEPVIHISVIETWNDSHPVLSAQKQGVVNHTHMKVQHSTSSKPNCKRLNHVSERKNKSSDCKLVKSCSKKDSNKKKKSHKK